jgi:hypothetical protein
MRCLWLSSVLMLAACSDPQVRVTIAVPDSYRSHVETIVLHILEPPASAPFDCDMLAFDEVEASATRLSQTQDVPISKGGRADLSGIRREGFKLFSAEGLDPDGQVVVAGCAEQGTIEHDVDLSITTFPTAVVAIPSVTRFPDFRVSVSDAYGRRLEGAELRWTVVGPKGVKTVIGDTTRIGGGIEAGTASLNCQSVEPPQAGPVVADVRVRWQRNSVASFPWMVSPSDVWRAPLEVDSHTGSPEDDGLKGNVMYYAVGRIGPRPPDAKGVTGFAALLDDAGQSTVNVFYLTPDGLWDFFRARSAPIPDAETIGVVPGSDADKLVVIAADLWAEVGSDGIPARLASLSRPPPSEFRATKIAAFGACGSATIGSVVVGFEPQTPLPTVPMQLRVYDPQGTEVSQSPFVTSVPPVFPSDPDKLAARLDDAGCISATDGTLYPAIVRADGNSGEFGPFSHTILLAGAGPGATLIYTTPWDVAASGIRFAPAIGSTTPQLVGAHLTTQNIFIHRLQILGLDVDSGQIELELVARDASPEFPQSTAAGDVDGDGLPDIVALLPFGPMSPEGSLFSLLIVLGVEHRGERVAAQDGVGYMANPQLWLADLDGDGIDDIIVGERPMDGTTNIWVYHMGPTN